MLRLTQKLLAFLGAADDLELAQQIQFLKVENKIMRSKLPERVSLTEQERKRLLKFGKLVGAAIKELITIVSPRTFARWLSGESESKRAAKKLNSPGRPRTPEEIRDLIVRLADENAWGYTRILGELKKLGIGGVSRSTIANILKEYGFETAPKRGERTILHSRRGTRRVHIVGMTGNSDDGWIVQQAMDVSMFRSDATGRNNSLGHDAEPYCRCDQLTSSGNLNSSYSRFHCPSISTSKGGSPRAMRYEK
jgi:hypothetical protein